MTTTYKPTNPKDALGSTRAALHLNPAEALTEMSLALVEGMLKYGAHNFVLMGARASVYLAAASRHLEKFKLGRDRDPASLVHELGYTMACCAIVIVAQRRGTLVDDRGPAIPSEEIDRLFAEAEATIKHLASKFELMPGSKHWTIADTGVFSPVAGPANDVGAMSDLMAMSADNSGVPVRLRKAIANAERALSQTKRARHTPSLAVSQPSPRPATSSPRRAKSRGAAGSRTSPKRTSPQSRTRSSR